MEKEIYFEKYLPFAKESLISVSDYVKNRSAKAGNYSNSYGKKMIDDAFSGFIDILQDFVGPIYSPVQGLSEPLPEKWQWVLDYLKDNKIISNINFSPFYCDEPKLIRITSSSHPDFSINFNSDGNFPLYGMSAHGDSEDMEEAISKLIGEILERYPLLIYRNKHLLKASIRNLINKKESFLSPEIISGFSRDQKKNSHRYNFNERSVFCWTEGKSLFSGKKVLIPSQLIFWNYNFQKNGWQEPILREPNTNGAGGHYTLTKAILGGLYELIQRDGFLIYWLNGLSPQKIKNDSITYEPLKKLLEECKDCRLEIIFLNTSTELEVPSCICVILDHSGTGPKVAVGGGCESDWNKALYRSLIETLGVHHWMRLKKTNSKEDYLYLDKISEPFKDRKMNQIERLLLWANEKMFDRIRFFISGEEIDLGVLTKNQTIFSSDEEELKCLVEKFKSFGSKEYEIFCYQAKHKILDDLGFYSVKIIVPALIHLYLRETSATLGSKRIKEVPAKLGFKAAENLNPWPHPFP